MSEFATQILPADATGVQAAAAILRRGGLVAFPTETVYGLGADATSDRAVARVFEAKNRPQFNPLIVHLADVAAVHDVAVLDGDAKRLADAFWPGPLTLVLPLRPDAGLSPLVTAGSQTVAVRVPEQALAHAMLAEFGGPVAAPSANPSGRISPTTAQHVANGLGGRIEAILDGGTCAVGLESTIIGFAGIGFAGGPTLLRPGGLPAEAIAACLGGPLGQPEETSAPSAPGQLASHYAPVAAVRLDARQKRAGELLLGFGEVAAADLNLSPSGDLVEAAANLFGHLHVLDTKGAETIAVSPIPDRGLGRAINDRLRRAAAPRR